MNASQEVAFDALCEEVTHEFGFGAHELRVVRFMDGFLLFSDLEVAPTAVFGISDEESR